MIHYRVAFPGNIYYHIIASSNVKNIPAPNGMASIFMQSDNAPKRISPHLLETNPESSEYTAMEHMIEDLENNVVKKKAISKIRL
jgi:hypothetical protein